MQQNLDRNIWWTNSNGFLVRENIKAMERFKLRSEASIKSLLETSMLPFSNLQFMYNINDTKKNSLNSQ